MDSVSCDTRLLLITYIPWDLRPRLTKTPLKYILIYVALFISVIATISRLMPLPSRPPPAHNLCDHIKYDSFLVAWSDGTVHLMDSHSEVPRWKLATGSPLLQSKRVDPDVKYFIDIGDDGQLFENSKSFGRRELNLTIEELAGRLKIVERSSFMFGTKYITYYVLNEANGEVHATYRVPRAGAKVGWEFTEETVYKPVSDTAGFIVLMRTDFTLFSIAFPKHPPHFSLEPDNPSWQISDSRIGALYIESIESPRMLHSLLFPAECQIEIPVKYNQLNVSVS